MASAVGDDILASTAGENIMNSAADGDLKTAVAQEQLPGVLVADRVASGGAGEESLGSDAELDEEGLFEDRDEECGETGLDDCREAMLGDCGNDMLNDCGDIQSDEIRASIEEVFPTTFAPPDPGLGVSLPDQHAGLLAAVPGDHDGQEQEQAQEPSQEQGCEGLFEDREASDSLFISENEPLSLQSANRASASTAEIVPDRPSVGSCSTAPARKRALFGQIVGMQGKLLKKKELSTQQTPAIMSHVEPDNESYLEAVTQGRLPLTSASGAPAVDEDVLLDRQATAEFAKQKRHFDNLKANAYDGRLTFRQDIEWMKISGAEEARRRKRARDTAKTHETLNEDELFPQAFSAAPASPETNIVNPFDFDDFDSARPTKRARRDLPQKLAQPASMQDVEYESMQVAMEAFIDKPTKKKKTAEPITGAPARPGRGKAAKPKTRSGPLKAKGAAKATKAGGQQTEKQKRALNQARQQAASLFHSNVFTQQAGPGATEQPNHTSANKNDALKELIASLPIGDTNALKGEMNILLSATRDFDGHGSVRAVPKTNLWKVKGMRTALRHYQILGSAFMRRRENALEKPKGGILADQMGLGKTLMMLANIVNGQPAKGTKGNRTTLLVASPALLTQWKSEIEQHTDRELHIMRYGAGNRLDSTNAFDVLRAHDIVLTTYTEVMRSYPKNDPPAECQSAEQKLNWWKETYEQQRGVLHRTMFLRVVLDEAQAIKGHTGRTSIACRALMAEHKWALSGTPIMNSLAELYPYFKFIGVPHTGTFKIFKQNYCGSDETSERLMVRLSQFMLRRTHSDEMFGGPILILPAADQDTYWCEFNPVERCIYEIVKSRFTARLNSWSQNNELEKSYGNALVMLLRLRQLTSHVLMLQLVMKDLLEREDIQIIKEITNDYSADATSQSGRYIVAVRRQLDQHAAFLKKTRVAKEKAKAEAKASGREYQEEEVMEDEEVEEGMEEATAAAADDDDDEEGSQQDRVQYTAGEDFGKAYNFKPFLRSLETGESWEKVKKKSRCTWCSKPPRLPWMTSCAHLICESPCMEEANLQAAEEGRAHFVCKACGITPKYIHPCESDAGDTPEAVAHGTRSQARKKEENKKKSKQPVRPEEEDIEGDWLSSESVLPSAKTVAVKAQIMNWTRKNPQVKIIVYTQFLAMIRILAKICQMEGWKVEQYHGKMSLPSRDKAIASFATDPDTRIMLASLRCGSLGLNLTMASKVIILDPWWNSASEQQAFCRVFRIGQSEETFLSRICVKNTVDEKLLGMQKRKDAEIQAVMENDGKKVSRLTIRDLMRLFGNLREDESGRPFIMVQNADPRGGYRADKDGEGYADDE